MSRCVVADDLSVPLIPLLISVGAFRAVCPFRYYASIPNSLFPDVQQLERYVSASKQTGVSQDVKVAWSTIAFDKAKECASQAKNIEELKEILSVL